MSEDQARKLCLALMRADTEDAVINLLKEAGYWDNPDLWRYYGDNENNFSTIGNQQASADAAFVEKIVNSIDARLMNICRERGIDPEGGIAPQSIREAVAAFFEDHGHKKSTDAGNIKNWPSQKRTQVAKGITVAATGHGPKIGNPCLTVADCGEGQTPDEMPMTFLSLNRSNKLRVPFVQGKFNMGGTGALVFCGRHNIQLIVSRRNPVLLSPSSQQSDTQWGFTVVRREDPSGNRRSSVYTYLAPLGADGSRKSGGVLRFTADAMPLFPELRDAYERGAEYGTLIKLYEYYLTKYGSNILRKDGLLMHLDLLLPDIALPMRLYECRPEYKGHQGSFETTLNGLIVRLNDDKSANIEDGFPDSGSITVKGENISFGIYAFKKDRAETYRKDEGVIFVVNGQTHARISRDFFRRTAVGLSYISDSILVVVDCSSLSGRSREDLFKNSRDRLNHGPLQMEIESVLQDLLKNHQGLRSLKEQRRREEIQSQFEDTKPIENILEALVKNDPALSELFLAGGHITNPFKMLKAGQDNKPYTGKRYPSYFKFKGEKYGKRISRGCHLNMRCRISFETDADNDYFKRDRDPGRFLIHMLNKGGGDPLPVDNSVIHLYNGIATLSLRFPENIQAGESLTFITRVDDNSRIEPFENTFTVTAKEPADVHEGGGSRPLPPGPKPGDRDVPSKISLPQIHLVDEENWNKQTPVFDKYTALRINNIGDGQGYDFKVNIDNVYLKIVMKRDLKSAKLLRNRFIYAQVLLGLAILSQDQHEKEKNKSANGDEEIGDEDKINIEDKVEAFSRAVAPVILPIIERLGALDPEDASSIEAFSEAI